VLVVDDHALFRRGLQMVLDGEADIEVVGEAADGQQALERAQELMPDVVLMDVRMPRRSGIEATREIRAVLPHVRVLMLTVSDEEADLYEAIKAHSYFAGSLFFHPTSQTIEDQSKMLAAGVKIKTTAELFAQIDYQPLNPGTAIGQVRFVKTADLATVYVGFRDIVVLDSSPGDISVTAALISEEFQTPLSHINVPAQNRGTPNMGLRKAMTNPTLRALEGKWCELTVGPFEYSIKEVSMAEADAFWEKHKPVPVVLPELDLTVTDLRNIQDVVVEGNGVSLRDAIGKAIQAYGAKSAGYSVLSNTEGVPSRKAFGIPASYYLQFMQANGFFARVDALLADPEFRDKAAVRDAKLRELRTDMLKAPVDPAFSALLKAKLQSLN